MASKITLQSFKNEVKQITDKVNASLLAAGRADLAIKASDFGLQESNRESKLGDLLLKFAIGDGLNVDVAPIGDLESERNLGSFVNELAKAIPNLDRARKFLLRYHRSVRAAANAAVKSAQKSGCEIKFGFCGF